MRTSLGDFDGNSWEALCQKLLRQKYPDYQEVPAQFGGDLGIEGFTRSGLVFQCYCPDENLTGNDLYEKQRNKITLDINKLLRNLRDIAALGTGAIREWQFLTPVFNSRNLIAHCRTKEGEVLASASAHVAPSFTIFVRTEDDFIAERQIVLGTSGLRIHSSASEPDDAQIGAFLGSGNELIENITTKLRKLERPARDSERAQLAARLATDYLIGQQELETLSQKYPAVHAAIVELKQANEARVTTLSLTHTGEAGVHLRQVLADYSTKLSDDFKERLSSSVIERLANEAIADWLGRCPLDFPDSKEPSNAD